MFQKVKRISSLIKKALTNRQKGTNSNSDKSVKENVNPLWEYFQNNKKGNGIWKWEHYFDVYHSHFKKFINKEVTILEIGIFSGGSLGMWRSYFGNKCKVYGIDIEDACKAYENDYTTVFIGDQEDRNFWKNFFDKVGPIDIVIDDGGHTPEQQRITFEETLPKMKPGGVFICEDIHGVGNKFTEYLSNEIHNLNYLDRILESQILESNVSKSQSTIKGFHFYPYLFVVEIQEIPISKLRAPKHGSRWQPFFDNRIQAKQSTPDEKE